MGYTDSIAVSVYIARVVKYKPSRLIMAITIQISLTLVRMPFVLSGQSRMYGIQAP